MKKSAFTIIELLFVLAIIGVMITIGSSFYQREMTKFKIERAALHYQRILQAGINYYADNGSWPSDGKSDGTGTFNESYIGKQITKNPWNVDYYNYYKPVVTPDRPDVRFKVSSNFLSCDIAQRVAALLPVAGTECVDANKKYLVNAYVIFSKPLGSNTNTGLLATDQSIITHIDQAKTIYFPAPGSPGMDCALNDTIVVSMLSGIQAQGLMGYGSPDFIFNSQANPANCTLGVKGVFCNFSANVSVSSAYSSESTAIAIYNSLVLCGNT